jgi:hypothetical protein
MSLIALSFSLPPYLPRSTGVEDNVRAICAAEANFGAGAANPGGVHQENARCLYCTLLDLFDRDPFWTPVPWEFGQGRYRICICE